MKLAATQNFIGRYADQTIIQGITLTPTILQAGAPFILKARFEDDNFLIVFDALKRMEGRSDLGDFHHAPVLFYEGRNIGKPQRRLREVLALFLTRVQGKAPERGVICHGKECLATTVRLTPGLKAAQDLLDAVTQMRQGESSPKLVLNNHCSVCEFQRRCQAQAVVADDLSLLRGLRDKELKGYSRKGLFTLTQLAHTFRPRRKGKRSDRRSTRRYHALQALAIRDKRIYVLGAPQVPSGAVRIFLDVEGDPEEGFVYLIGMIVCDTTGDERRYSFWADSKDQECGIFDQFIDIVSQYDCPLVYCYGSYERAFIKHMRRHVKRKTPVDKILETLVNTLSIIYAHFYFPVYSNGLKSVAGCLGYSWSDADASGVQSIVWRNRWEQTGDEMWKRKLIEYNHEDCSALRKVTDFLRDAVDAAAAPPAPNPPTPSGTPQIVRVHELDKLANNRKWGRVNFAHPDFEFVNNCAYFDYQRQRVFVRTSRTIRKHRRKPGQQRNRKIRASKRIVIAASKCPDCRGTDVVKFETFDRGSVRRPRIKRALDLVITAGGMQRRVIECRASAYRCKTCGHTFVPDRHCRLAKHYHGLMSWAMYEHVAHQVSSGTLQEKFQEYFGMNVANVEIHMFKGLMARYYRATYRGLLAKILAGPVLHVDETEVKLRTGRGYVWVFTSLEEVVFLYKPTREGDFLREMLKDFKGVLISDFYAAYDSVGCDQQRCLIHLIRDMNQALLNNPFDQELKLVTLPFSSLLKSVVATVDQHGLKRHYLRRHQGDVDDFFRALAAQPLRSEAALELRTRLEKNQNKLFTFLQHDGVPWNNNNAENAIKRFAYYREGTVGTMKEAGLTDYLTLLSLYQTCRYKGVSFLKFLLSRKRDIDAFCAKGRVSRGPNIELYPKGFVPPHFVKRGAAKDVKEPTGCSGC